MTEDCDSQCVCSTRDVVQQEIFKKYIQMEKLPILTQICPFNKSPFYTLEHLL